MPRGELHALTQALIIHVRGLIRSGALTERGLARLIGYSQPHVHNVLAGVRGANVRFADDVMVALGISIEQLLSSKAENTPNQIRVPLCAGALSSNRAFPTELVRGSVVTIPAADVTAPSGLLAMRVGADEDAMWPSIWPGDLVVIDSTPAARTKPDVDDIHVLQISGRGLLRRCHRVGSRLLSVADHSTSDGDSAEWIGLERRNILDVVRGRVVWLSRRLDGDAM